MNFSLSNTTYKCILLSFYYWWYIKFTYRMGKNALSKFSNWKLLIPCACLLIFFYIANDGILHAFFGCKTYEKSHKFNSEKLLFYIYLLTQLKHFQTYDPAYCENFVISEGFFIFDKRKISLNITIIVFK